MNRPLDMSRGRFRRWWPWLLVLVAVGGAAAFTSRRSALARSKAQAPRSPPPLVVTVATASQGDIGVHLDGLGTVTPIATVTVRTQLSGRLLKVGFTEGDQEAQPVTW